MTILIPFVLFGYGMFMIFFTTVCLRWISEQQRSEPVELLDILVADT